MEDSSGQLAGPGHPGTVCPATTTKGTGPEEAQHLHTPDQCCIPKRRASAHLAVVALEYPETSLFCFRKHNAIRQFCIKLSHAPAFENFILVCILCNCVTLGMSSNRAGFDHTRMGRALNKFEFLWIAIFTAEALLKIVSMGFILAPGTYMRDGWNWIDVIVVALGYVDIFSSGNLTAVRTVRVLRPLRAITRVQGMKVLVSTMIESMPMLIDVVFLCAFTFFIWGIMAAQLFAGALKYRCSDPDFTYAYTTASLAEDKLVLSNVSYIVSDEQSVEMCSGPLTSATVWYQLADGSVHDFPGSGGGGFTCSTGTYCTEYGNPNYGMTSFDSILWAWLTIFQCITLESWTDVMYFTSDAVSWWVWPLFVALIVFGAFFLVSLSLAVIFLQFASENKDTHDEERRRERDKAKRRQQRQQKKQERPQKKHLERHPRGSGSSSGEGSSVGRASDGSEADSGLSEQSCSMRPGSGTTARISLRSAVAGKSTELRPLEMVERRSYGAVSGYLSVSSTLSEGEMQTWSAIRVVAYRVATSRQLTYVTIAIILVNTTVMCFNWYGMPYKLDQATNYINYAITIYFAVELLTKLMGFGFQRFFRSGVNIFDLIVVMLSLVEMIIDLLPSVAGLGPLSVLRMLRLLRVLRLKRSWHELYVIIQAILRSVMSTTYLMLLMLLFMFISALMGMQLFGYKFMFCDYVEGASALCPLGQRVWGDCPNHFYCYLPCSEDQYGNWVDAPGSFYNGLAYCDRFCAAADQWGTAAASTEAKPSTNITVRPSAVADAGRCEYLAMVGKSQVPRANFDNLFWAMLTVFQLLTGENWNNIMYDSMRTTTPWASMYYVIVILLGTYVVFNLFIAILLDNFTGGLSDSDSTEDEKQSEGKEVEMSTVDTKLVPGGAECFLHSKPRDWREKQLQLRRLRMEAVGSQSGYDSDSDKSSLLQGAREELGNNWAKSLGASISCGCCAVSPGHIMVPSPCTAEGREPMDSGRGDVDEASKQQPSAGDDDRQTLRRNALSILCMSMPPISEGRSRAAGSEIPISPPDMVVGEHIPSRRRVVPVGADGRPSAALWSSRKHYIKPALLSWQALEAQGPSRGPLSPQHRHQQHRQRKTSGGGELRVYMHRVGVWPRFKCLGHHAADAVAAPPGSVYPTPSLPFEDATVKVAAEEPTLVTADSAGVLEGTPHALHIQSKHGGASGSNKFEEGKEAVGRQQRLDLSGPIGSSKLQPPLRQSEPSTPFASTRLTIDSDTGGIEEVNDGENDNDIQSSSIPGSSSSSRSHNDNSGSSNLGGTLRRFLRRTMSLREVQRTEHLSNQMKGRSLLLFGQTHWLRWCAAWLVHSSYFETVILVFIVASSIALALDTPSLDPNSNLAAALRILDYIFTAMFTLEAALKIVTFGFGFTGERAYVRNGWNVLDLLIVLVGWVLIMVQASGTEESNLQMLRVLRTLRALRPLRTASRFPELRIVVNALFAVLPAMMHVALMSVLFYLIFAILAVNLFKGKLFSCIDADSGERIDPFYVLPPGEVLTRAWCEEGTQIVSQSAYHSSLDVLMPMYNISTQWARPMANFDNVGIAILTLFQVATLELWVDIAYSAVDAVGVGKQPVWNHSPAALLFFIVFISVCSFFVLNLFVGVTLEKVAELQREQMASSVFVTPQQQAWVDVQKLLLRTAMQPRPSRPDGPPWRLKLYNVVTGSGFSNAILGTIFASTVLMALVRADMSDVWQATMSCSNLIFTCIFFAEAVLKILSFGPWGYFRDGWNCFDFFMAAVSVASVALDFSDMRNLSFMPVLRVLRVVRVIRLIRRATGVQRLLMTLVYSLPALVNVGGIILLFFTVYAIIGMNLFGNLVYGDFLNRHTNFQNFPNAMLALIRLITGESWNGIMQDCMVTRNCVRVTVTTTVNITTSLYTSTSASAVTLVEGTYLDTSDPLLANLPSDVTENQCALTPAVAVLFFASFVILCGFILLNLMIAVILENLMASEADEALPVSPTMVERFVDAWGAVDPGASGVIHASKLPLVIGQLEPPMGTKGLPSRTAIQAIIMSVDIPVYENNQVTFLETLHALSGRLAGCELPEIEEDWMMNRYLRGLPGGSAAFPKYTAAHFHAALQVKAAIQGFMVRLKLREREQQMATTIATTTAGAADGHGDGDGTSREIIRIGGAISDVESMQEKPPHQHTTKLGEQSSAGGPLTMLMPLMSVTSFGNGPKGT